MQTSYIKDELQLKRWCEQASEIKTFSIDTEFQRRDTYYAIPALLQIAYVKDDELHAACFDAKTIKDWSLLQSLLSDAEACVMHSSDQDFEIFDQIFPDWNFTIRDTQLACALLGAQPQLGYAGMIKQELGFEIDKSQTRTNWLQRPLTQKQIDYALSDVTHLLTAWDKLRTQLDEAGRYAWFLEDCERLIPTHQKLKNNSNAWKKLKGIRNLSQSDFVTAAALAAWREETAQKRDRPRRWVIDDETVLNLAEEPRRLREFAVRWKVLKENVDTVEELLESPDSQYTEITDYASMPLNETEKKRYQVIKEFVAQQAKRLDIESNTLSNRKTLEKIARGHTDFLETTNWRHRLLLDYLNEHVFI